jgi:transposase
MGKPYSEDLRKRVVAAVVTGGLSCSAAAKRFGVAVSTAIGWVRLQRQTGSLTPGKMGGHRPKAITGEHQVWVLERVKRDFTLRGLVAELAERGLKVDYQSVWKFVHAEKLSFKKSVVAGERDRPDVARRRAQWLKYQDRVEAERLVFIDETWTRTDMAALRGWAPRGQRLCAKVPHGRWKTMTFLAALRHDLIEGPIDGDSFRLYVEKVLLPTLRPGDIVVMDNLGSHRSKTVRQLIRSVGAKLFFLPKYSPTSTRSSRYSPNSSTSCEKLLPERSKLFASPSATFSSSSRPETAQATW